VNRMQVMQALFIGKGHVSELNLKSLPFREIGRSCFRGRAQRGDQGLGRGCTPGPHAEGTGDLVLLTDVSQMQHM
jgi:hypothetical protein